MDFSHYTSAKEDMPLPALWSDTTYEPQEVDIYRLTAKKHEFLYLALEPLTKAYEIVKGYVKLSQYSEAGRETIVSLLKPGDMLGNFDPTHPYAYEHAQAMSKVELKVFESPILKRAIRHNPAFVLQMLSAQQKRNYQLQRQIASIAFRDVAERIQEFLLFLAREFGKMQDRTAFIDNFLTHRDISLINQTSRQSVSTILSRMKSKGTIYYDRHQLIIHVDKLKRAVQADKDYYAL
ncbi:MAG: Crp/Fnr family transcriptional regulator [Bacteroidota bacterium]